MVFTANHQTKEKSQQRQKFGRESAQERHTQTFSSTSRKQRGRSQHPSSIELKCRFCEAEHYASECTRYSTTEARQNRAEELKLCFVCLKSGHMSKYCRQKGKTCFACGEKHNRAFCTKKASGKRSEAITAPAIESAAHASSNKPTENKDIPLLMWLN